MLLFTFYRKQLSRKRGNILNGGKKRKRQREGGCSFGVNASRAKGAWNEFKLYTFLKSTVVCRGKGEKPIDRSE